jgi:tetratricopeptide (TPR) repeat protein
MLLLHLLGICGLRRESNRMKPRSATIQHMAIRLCQIAILCCGMCGCTRLAQNGTGVTLYQQGRFAEALHTFEQAKQADPTNADTHYNLASTYHRLGTAAKDQKMLGTAEAIYNQSLELAPNHVECHRALAVLLVETGRPDKAFTLLKRWAQSSPNVSDARVELAKLHQEFSQTKIAEQYLDEALAMDPNNARAWAERGRLRENSGELMQAVQNYQQSIALNSLQPDLYQRIGALNVRLTQNALTSTSRNIAGTQSVPSSPTLNAVAPSSTNSASNTSPPTTPTRY